MTAAYTDLPGHLMPIGHLVNARAAIGRYVEAGSQLDRGAVLDELDELRRLVDDVAAAVLELEKTTRATRRRDESAEPLLVLSKARMRLLEVARGEMQHAWTVLMADLAQTGHRKAAA